MDCRKKRKKSRTNDIFHVDYTGASFDCSETKHQTPRKQSLRSSLEVRATIYPAVMQQYNLAVILRLSCRPITNRSAEAKITTVVGVIWNNHFHEFMFRETHQ